MKTNTQMRKNSNNCSAGFYRSVSFILLTFLAFITYTAKPAPIKADSLRVEILLNSKMLGDIKLNDKFINALDVTADRLILLSTTNQYYLLGWGGIVPLGDKISGNISSFAFTSDNLLMTVRNNELCRFDSLGHLIKLYKLPGAGMGLCAGKNVMYLYDQNRGKTNYALYVIVKGGKYSKLIEVPSPIKSVFETNNSVLFATENGIFDYNLKSKSLKAIAALPKDKQVNSIAEDTLNRRVYFSTDSAVYAVKDSHPALITNKFGGTLRYFNNGLIIFVPEKQLVIRMAGIEHVLASKTTPAGITSSAKQALEALNNESIINLVKEQLSDDLIIKIINKSETNFDVSINAMIELSSHNVSSAVISAMKTAMKKKNTGDQKNN